VQLLRMSPNYKEGSSILYGQDTFEAVLRPKED